MSQTGHRGTAQRRWFVSRDSNTAALPHHTAPFDVRSLGRSDRAGGGHAGRILGWRCPAPQGPVPPVHPAAPPRCLAAVAVVAAAATTAAAEEEEAAIRSWEMPCLALPTVCVSAAALGPALVGRASLGGNCRAAGTLETTAAAYDQLPLRIAVLAGRDEMQWPSFFWKLTDPRAAQSSARYGLTLQALLHGIPQAGHGNCRCCTCSASHPTCLLKLQLCLLLRVCVLTTQSECPYPCPHCFGLCATAQLPPRRRSPPPQRPPARPPTPAPSACTACG